MIEVCIYSEDGVVTEYYAGDCARRIVMERAGRPRVRVSEIELNEHGEELYPDMEIGECAKIGMKVPGR
jgi:hypothetical protein